MLQVKDLTFSYGKRKILENINIKLNLKDRISLLGPNGTGKSTFLNLLMGRFIPQKGRVYLNEKQIQEISKRELAKEVSYIPQFHSPSFDFRVLDVVMMGRTAHLAYFESPEKKDIERAEYYL